QDTFAGPPGVPYYNWTFSANTSGATFSGSTNGPTVTVNNGGVDGSYTLNLDEAGPNCPTSSCTKVVSVSANPPCSIGKTGGTDCSGTQDTFQAPSGTGLTYSWSLSANSSGATIVGS